MSAVRKSLFARFCDFFIKPSPQEIQARYDAALSKVDTFEKRVEIPRAAAKKKARAATTQGLVEKALRFKRKASENQAKNAE